MKTFAVKEKRAAPAIRRSQPSRFGYRGPEVKTQQAEIRRILRSTRAQAKLTIGQPNDKYEQEADRVADQIMRMFDTDVAQRQQENEEEEETLQTKPLSDQITPLVQRQEEPPEGEETAQRQPMKKEEEELQAKSKVGEAPEVTPAISSRIQSLQGGGWPLPKSGRSFFEHRIGADFSKVRVHNDTQAASAARSVNARAFTVCPDVAFGAEQYQPNTSSGRKLLAHELTHVVQQSNSSLVANPDHVARQTEGEKAAGRAKDWLETNNKLKIEVDVLKATISEIKRGKSVDYNKNAGLKRIDNAATLLGISATKLNSLKADWKWLVDQRAISAKASYRKKQAGFFSSLRSPLEKIKKKYSGQQTHYWLKNSPAQVLEIIIKVADADLPADEL